MSSSHRVGRFVGDLRAGNPRVTFFSQSAPLLFLVPTGLWLAHGQGNLLWSAIGWAIGGSAFNALWFPYLRRNEHPPHGSSQSVAAATCAAAVFFTPQLWLLLSAFIAMGVALGLLSGSRRHPLFQTVCAYLATYFAVRAGISDALAWGIAALFIIPLGLAAVSFVTAELALARSQLSSVLRSSGATAWDIDEQGVVQRVLGVEVTGIEEGTPLSEIIHPDDHRPATLEQGQSIEYRVCAGPDSWRWIRESVEAASEKHDNRRSGVVDITDEKEAIEDDRRRARTDSLTGQASRSDHMREADVWAGRGEGFLVLVDLDDFKQVNDTLGHSIGDRVLHHVAHRLAAVDPTGHVARLGGDEFACLVAGDAERAHRVADEFVTSAMRPLSIDSMIVHSGVSAGVAPFGEGLGADEVRRQAGLALRAAKNSGGADVFFYDAELELQSARRNELAKQLPHGLANGEFVAHYQPKLDLVTREIIGFEALVRWENPTFGLLSPFEFLDLIAVGGHHRALYPVILDRALSDLGTLLINHPGLAVSVNVHSQNLRERDFVEITLETLERHGLESEHLILELTEEAVIGEDSGVIENLEELSDSGIELSIDDFGTGFSSLSYLARLPVKEVKLDRSLVGDISASPKGRSVAEFVLGLANRLELRVVGEGIEDEETLEYLAENRCQLGQGYFIGRPERLADAIENSTFELPATRQSLKSA